MGGATEMKVRFTPRVENYFYELEDILYEKGYFGFEESAHEYADELILEIIATLPVRVHRPAPRHFDPYGNGIWMTSFRKNRNTTWYAFFTKYDDVGETVYLVHRIENNHTASQYM